MIESWKAHLNNGTKFGAIMMDFQKPSIVSNIIFFSLKLHAYGLGNSLVEFFCCHISNRYQRSEAATGGVLQKKMFLEIHRKKPVPESLF